VLENQNVLSLSSMVSRVLLWPLVNALAVVAAFSCYSSLASLVGVFAQSTLECFLSTDARQMSPMLRRPGHSQSHPYWSSV